MTAAVKLRGKVNFPATVTAEGGFQIVKANGVWTLSPKWDDLTLETTIPDPEARQLWTLDPVNNVYARLSVQALIDNLPEGPEGPQGDPGNDGANGTNGAGYGGTSATSLLIANSVTKVFTTQAGLAYQVGNYARASSAANGANFMEGTVSAYTGTSLSIAVTKIGGSGTYADWAFQIAGAPGTNGAVAISGTPTVNQFANWTDATTIKGTSITGLVKGNGASAPAAAVAGTDYLAPAAIGVTVQAYDATIVNAAAIANTKIDAIEFVIDGGGATITTGVKGYLEVPFACTITRSTLMADQSGSIVVDVWKDTYANFPPVVGDKITASAPPTISAATKAQDSTLTGWTTSVAAGDILAFNVNSVTTCQRVTISLRVTKT